MAENDAAVEAVAASIREFGFRQPIVVDEAGVIICGHTRFKAAKHLGLAKVPVHVAMRDYFKRSRFTVLNCTPDSGLTAFEHLPFEDAVAKASAECGKKVNTKGWYT